MQQKKIPIYSTRTFKGKKTGSKDRNLIEIAPSLLVYTRLVKIIPQSRSFLSMIRLGSMRLSLSVLFSLFLSFSLHSFSRFRSSSVNAYRSRRQERCTVRSCWGPLQLTVSGRWVCRTQRTCAVKDTFRLLTQLGFAFAVQ